MADEPTPADQSAPAAAPETKTKPAKKAKRHTAKHAKSVKETRASPRAAPAASAGLSSGALIAVYVVLGLLALGLSFYTGYLVGKSGGLGGGTQTGSGTQALAGAVPIIEYSDYQCPFCGRVEPTIEQLKQQYGDKITLEYKNFPLESIHPYALNASIAAECARDQGTDQFWKYHDTLFQNQDKLDVASLKSFAQAQGLNMNKFNDCYDNQKTLSRIRADQQEAQARGVSGTPSFWIKDELVVGALPLSAFQQKIDDKLAGKAAAPAAPQQPQAPQPSGPVDVALGSHVMGDANAKVTIIEFSDYQCPFCKRFYTDTEQQLIDTYVKTGKAKFSYRNFPLSFHQNAQISAEAAECAGAQGKYWEYHDVLFTKGNGDGTGLDAASLKQYAADLKLDTAKFGTCLDSHQMAGVVQKDESDGSTAGVQGTPTFYVNGQQLVGAQPFSAFQAAIDPLLK